MLQVDGNTEELFSKLLPFALRNEITEQNYLFQIKLLY